MKVFDSIKRKAAKIDFTGMKLLALIIIVVMMAADYYPLRDFFRDGAGFKREDAKLYSLVMALVLEGIPFYMGLANSERMDKNCYVKNDHIVNEVGLRISKFIMGFAIILAMGLRLAYILYQLTSGVLDMEEAMLDTMGQAFLVVSPALTSLTAYTASWFAFRSNYLKKCENERDKAKREYQYWNTKFQIARSQCIESRSSLAASLGIDVPATDFDEFRQECFARIRAKLTDNCIVAYPTQVERFSSEVEKALAEYILEMSKHTTTPHEILRIKVSDIIEKYENMTKNYADSWDYDMAGPDLERELRRTLDTAVVTAQFKTAVHPYYFHEKR